MQNERPSAWCQHNRRQKCFKELVTGSLDALIRDGPIPARNVQTLTLLGMTAQPKCTFFKGFRENTTKGTGTQKNLATGSRCFLGRRQDLVRKRFEGNFIYSNEVAEVYFIAEYLTYREDCTLNSHT